MATTFPWGISSDITVPLAPRECRKTSFICQFEKWHGIVGTVTRRRATIALFAFVSLFVPGVPSVHALPSSAVFLQGANPFQGTITLTELSQTNIAAVSFMIEPRDGALAKPVRATYSRRYINDNDLLDTETGDLTVPIFGMYDDYANSIRITIRATNGAVRRYTMTAETSEWSNSCRDGYANPERVVDRNSSVKLDFSYMLLKAWGCGSHPVILDTDGYIRWASEHGGMEQGSLLVGNRIITGYGSDLFELGLDGSFETIGSTVDTPAGSFGTHHHNIDLGKKGVLLQLNGAVDVESDVLEYSTDGEFLKHWDFADIVADAITAGGDSPAAFVRRGVDWFHSNAVTYWRARDEIVVSAREDFVISVDYRTGRIKWILGDPTKAWYQYDGLRKYALTLPEGDHYPMGQHAVSITSNGRLMLFDNGYGSFAHDPAGGNRSYAAPRQYTINQRNLTADEVWNFQHGKTLDSQICSSIYQAGDSYLIDYASNGWDGFRLIGIDSEKRIAFEYKYWGMGFDTAWNAQPVHLESISY